MGRHLIEARFAKVRCIQCYVRCIIGIFLLLIVFMLILVYCHYQRHDTAHLDRWRHVIAEQHLKQGDHKYAWVIHHALKLQTLEQRQRWSANLFHQMQELMLYPGSDVQLLHIETAKQLQISIHINTFADIKRFHDYLQNHALFGLCQISQVRSLSQGGDQVDFMCSAQRIIKHD